MIMSNGCRVRLYQPQRGLRGVFLLCSLVEATAILLNSMPTLQAAPIVGKPTTTSSKNKSRNPSQRRVFSRSGTLQGSVVIKIQAGSGNHQDSTDNSVHIGHQDNRKYYSPHTYITYVTKVYKKTIIMPSVNGAKFGFAIFPASPLPTDDPLSIPFILMNEGTKSVYNLGYDSIIHSFRTPDTVAGGVVMDDNVSKNETVQKAVFGPNDHFPFSLEAAIDLTGSVIAKPGTTADVEFIVRYSNNPTGPILTNRYRFSLILVHGETWDWVRTD